MGVDILKFRCILFEDSVNYGLQLFRNFRSLLYYDDYEIFVFLLIFDHVVIDNRSRGNRITVGVHVVPQIGHVVPNI